MRRKKHKHTRRAVRFYKINFGFRSPFKVLIDGNFAHALQAQTRGDCNEQITKLLGDTVRLFTTKCIMHELRNLGKDYSSTTQACKQFALHHCGHEDPVSAADCLASQIESGNSDHFFVATQDKSLQRRVMSHTGCAVIFASVNGIHLETPSEHQKRIALEAERAQRRARQGEVDDEGRRDGKREGGGVVFRRKKAKGPNPLSMKKKKKNNAGGGSEKADAASIVSNEETKKRKRTRRKKSGDTSD